LLACLPDLVDKTLYGDLEDEVMIEEVGGFLEINMDDLKKDSSHTSRKRCILLTNPVYRQKKIDQAAALKAEDDAVKARKEEKSNNKKRKAEEAEGRKREMQRRVDNDQAPKKLIKVKCGGGACIKFCYKDDDAYKEWKFCGTNKCKKPFCSEEECVLMYEEHIKRCK
jgi:hypothetical protein